MHPHFYLIAKDNFYYENKTNLKQAIRDFTNITLNLINLDSQITKDSNKTIASLQDSTSLNNNSTNILKSQDSKSQITLLLNPTLKDIQDFFTNPFDKTLIIISNNPPPKEYQSFFSIKNLPNKYGILTTQQKQSGISEAEALEFELGLSVIDSPFTLKDIGGATALKKYTAQFLRAEQKGYKAKGIFLVGIPGTGKTFFPKCFAGELKRMLIALNLSYIMESNAPIEKLNSIFAYLHQRAIDYPAEKFVILIDEIEKMIGNATAKEKQMLGRLLTILNDINTPACEYKFNAIFFATANDLGSILANNPEFLRRGRWDELFFINLPTHEYAIEMFEIYIKKYKLDFALELMSLDEIFAEIENKYQKDNTIANRFPYTPAEIENFCKRLDFVKKAEGENFKKEDIIECVEMIIPLTKSAQDGLNKMVAQKELFIEI
ncbi:AAA family ATPase [Helicobacter turcicus]|uniref:Uncharacterized AAA domain-containing protein ycf46 n=1 Tax=Helicobacter turcicus TaxID=2867412 RepID=A0ABS7JP88_9HELI|nr:ATP-binding protein [Helicobacter turcicus]MBX7491229.1 ATP-binding protein [Helicobacter turcicus]MBX7546132.1 ATP-binding protein [Helicobacter turcicus]